MTELAERLPKLTVGQVNAAIQKHLKTSGIKVAIVARDAAGLRDLLTSGNPTPLTYDTQGTPEDVLEEDKQIAVFPLKNVTVRIVPVDQMFENRSKDHGFGQYANRISARFDRVFAREAQDPQTILYTSTF